MIAPAVCYVLGYLPRYRPSIIGKRRSRARLSALTILERIHHSDRPDDPASGQLNVLCRAQLRAAVNGDAVGLPYLGLSFLIT